MAAVGPALAAITPTLLDGLTGIAGGLLSLGLVSVAQRAMGVFKRPA